MEELLHACVHEPLRRHALHPGPRASRGALMEWYVVKHAETEEERTVIRMDIIAVASPAQQLSGQGQTVPALLLTMFDKDGVLSLTTDTAKWRVKPTT